MALGAAMGLRSPRLARYNPWLTDPEVPMSNRPSFSRLGLRLSFALVAAAGLCIHAGAVRAAEPVPIEQADNDLTMLSAQVKDDKKGNEDLIGSIAAIQAEFFNIAPPAGEPPPRPRPTPARRPRRPTPRR
jgi:hypothetical protein